MEDSLRQGPAPEGPFDVAVVGAGAVGCAIAREVTRYGASCALVEAGPDVGAGTSKANTAILHTGFDAKPGTIESGLVRRGYELLGAYASEVGIPTDRTGALMVAWNREQRDALDGIESTARENGYGDARPVELDELYLREPNLGPGAQGPLEIPGEGIVCPFTTILALATEALAGGCELILNAPVGGVRRGEGFHQLDTARGPIRARCLVNAAGLRSDEIDAMLGHSDFRVRPRRGELIVFDKLARGLINHVLLPVPTEKTKGVLVSPTVYGNVLLGPTADDIDDKTDRATTAAGLASLMEAGARIIPRLSEQEVTATYVGLRAATQHRDYQLRIDPDRRYVCAGGIRSTGITASLAIAEWVREGLASAGLELSREAAPTRLRMPNIGEFGSRPHQDADLIGRDPDYGRIVCFCERVTRGEIRDALRSPIPPVDPDGLRRRTRALMGRCQGFFCGAEIALALKERDAQPPPDAKLRSGVDAG
ncbi:MAG TPA: NAD(P)/FAD-dependent oxidoreductase [Solirubrobacterales bacterium]|nr:NAD(P)/FAD-dependent oxidoreductase [Solirubrobacterales bacterium]